MEFSSAFLFVLQAQLQRSLDSSVSPQPRVLLGRRGRKAAPAAIRAGMGVNPLSEQDTGILDVEDEEEEDEVRKLQTHTQNPDNTQPPIIWLHLI